MPKLFRYLLFVLPAVFVCEASAAEFSGSVVFEVRETPPRTQPLAYATVALTAQNDGKLYAATTDREGVCRFVLPRGTYKADITYIGYEASSFVFAVETDGELLKTVALSPATVAIRDVVVTASESRGPTSASYIGKEAMSHLQPSSFEDLLELLPGGRATDPSFSSSNSIHLREIPTSGSDYATSSLGVSFLMDGIPMSNDARLQYQSGLTGISDRISLNRGIDMRTLPTDEISSVEIIRGIPSVQYGDLTSGLVKIRRKEGGHDLEGRFKADLGSQLFYLGKGFEWGGKADRLTMNVGATWLQSRADPRNTRQNYSRLTGSWRVGKRWETASPFRYSLGGSIDYTGSFDRVKSDQNIDEGPAGKPIERYKAGYNKIAAALNFSMTAKETSFFRSLDFSASLTSEFDEVDRWRYVALGGSYPIHTSLQEGVYDAEILPSQYEATLRVDSKPFYAFARAMTLFGADTPLSRNTFRAGAEWNVSKNHGGGLLYDTRRPISRQMETRPRRYDAIPGMHKIAAFVEANTSVTTGAWRFEAMAGLRASTMANLGSRYVLQGEFSFDPRFNASLTFPAFEVAGEPMRFTLAGGAGWHTKTPTLDQLFPDPVYTDYTQLNYYPDDASKRRVNMIVFKADPTNYALRAARNFKWEVRGDVTWAGNTFSVTYFRENMTSGFRTSTHVTTYSYRDYDESAIDASTLAGPPSLENLPYTDETVLAYWGRTTNGSRTFKKGIEFTFVSKRIRPIATKITVSGAYFQTCYENSEPQYIATSVSIGDKPYPYIGLYEQEDNYFYEVCNTNFLLDTQIPRLGLIFSTSFQCQWFYGFQSRACSDRPISYLDLEMNSHPFTEASASDGILQHMIRSVSDIAYLYRKTPFSMNVNLKVAKRLYKDKLHVALFVNRLFVYSPSYRNETNALIRRYSSPYFGMELNVKL